MHDDGLYIPLDSHVTAYCTSARFTTCPQLNGCESGEGDSDGDSVCGTKLDAPAYAETPT